VAGGVNASAPRSLTGGSRVEGLAAAARLLRGRTNRYAWFGLVIALFALIAATLLASRQQFDAVSWDTALAVHSQNPALWLLDLMPLVFILWGQYIGTVMSFQAGALLLDETSALREQTAILQHELERSAVAGHALSLPNRHAFAAAIGRAIGRRRLHGAQVAVLTLSSEQYAEVEQAQGGDAALTLLRQLVERLRSVLSESDLLAHFGQGDFGVMLPRVADEAEARRFASRIQFALDTPIQVQRQPLGLRVSIGIALFPGHGEDAETLIRHAEAAKFAAADEQRDYRVYESALDDVRSARTRRMAELHAALYNEGLADDYVLQQPLSAERPRRLRLLPYWNHPHQGRLEEAEFLNLPDRLSLVHSLTLWLLREGLARLAQWRADAKADLVLVMRVPDAALRQVALADIVTRLLGAHDLPAFALTLEMSETAIIAGGAHARMQLNMLRNAGVQIAVSGAGQPGTSALTSLYFPVTEAQVSALLLQRAFREPAVRSVFSAMLAVLHELGQQIMLAGVDTAELRSFAESLDATWLEGAAIHPRMTVADVERWIAAR